MKLSEGDELQRRAGDKQQALIYYYYQRLDTINFNKSQGGKLTSASILIEDVPSRMFMPFQKQRPPAVHSVSSACSWHNRNNGMPFGEGNMYIGKEQLMNVSDTGN